MSREVHGPDVKQNLPVRVSLDLALPDIRESIFSIFDSSWSEDVDLVSNLSFLSPSPACIRVWVVWVRVWVWVRV